MLISNCCNLITNKIDVSQLTTSNYISTENLLPNFGGITIATNLPKGKVTKFEKENILMSNIRPYFKKFYYSSISGGCSSDVLVLNVNKSIAIPKYIYYLLCSDKFVNMYVANCKGTKMPRGNKEVLLNYQFELPSYEVQQHIVDTIGSIDDLIDNLTNQISKYKEIMSKELSKLTSKSTSTIKLSSIVKESKEKIKNNDVKLMSVVNTSNLVLQEEYFNKNTASKDMCKYKILKKYYFAYNPARINIGSIGMHNYDILGAISPIYIVFTVDNNYIYYLDIFKSSEYMIKNINKKASGSVRQNLPFEQFASIEIPNIDLNELINFNLHCQTFYSQIKSTENEIQQLINLKNKYLQKFFA